MNVMDKKLLITSTVLGLLAVVLGAFAAHGLEDRIEASAIASFQTGVRYQMYHALLLLGISALPMISKKVKQITFLTILLGVILFSGSIYCLSINALTDFDFSVIGFITPIGGLLLIISWLILLINFLKIK